MSNNARYPYWEQQSAGAVQNEIRRLESADNKNLGKNARKRKNAKIRALKAIIAGRTSGKLTQPRSGSNTNPGANKRGQQTNSRSLYRSRVETSRPPMYTQNAEYLGCVFDPQSYTKDPPRIPTTFPFPTSTKRVEFTGKITPNASGNFQMIMQPQCGFVSGDLTTAGRYVGIILNDVSFTAANLWEQRAGVAGTGVHYMTDVLPENMIDRYRIVAASIKIEYEGAVNNMSGSLITALLPRAALRGTQNAVAANTGAQFVYTGFDPVVMEQQEYCTTTKTGQGAECIWIPRDDVDYDYMPFVSSQKVGGSPPYTQRETSVLVIHGSGVPTAINSFRYRMVLHVEYIASLLNTLSTSNTTEPSVAVIETAQKIANKYPQYITSPPSNADLSSSITNIAEKKTDDDPTLVESIGSTLTGYLSDNAGAFTSIAMKTALGLIL